MPPVHGPVDPEAWPAAPEGGAGLLLDGAADMDLVAFLGSALGRAGVVLAVGPEGGWADEDRATARAAGYRAVRLGPRTLRTENAGPVALALVQVAWGDLG